MKILNTTFSVIIFLLISIIAKAQSADYAMNSPLDNTNYYLSTQTQYHIPFSVLRNTTDTSSMGMAMIKYSYQVNAGVIQKEQAQISYTASNCVYPAGLAIYRIQISSPLLFSAEGNYDLKIWIDSVNGAPDMDPSNDTMLRHYKVFNNLQPRKGLLEYYYHLTCGPCGEYGTPFMENMFENYEDNMVIAKLHYSFGGGAPYDVYDCPESKFLDSTMFTFSGHPNCTFNRNVRHPYVNPTNPQIDFYPHVDACPTDSVFLFRDINFFNKVPDNLNIYEYQLDTNTNILSFAVNAQFLDSFSFSRPARLSCMLLEDSLYNIQWHGSAPGPDSIYHRYVVRKIYGGPLGKLNSVPNFVNAHQNVSLAVIDTLDTKYVKEHLYLVPILQEEPNSTPLKAEILNAEKFRMMSLEYIAKIDEKAMNKNQFKVFPNPAKNIVTVQSLQSLENCSYTLYSLDAKVMMQNKNITGTSFDIDISTLSSGIYFLNISNQHQIVRLKILKD